MAKVDNVEIDTSKLSEENIKNFKKEGKEKDEKKWASCEIFDLFVFVLTGVSFTGLRFVSREARRSV
jgi:hypothetical protein